MSAMPTPLPLLSSATPPLIGTTAPSPRRCRQLRCAASGVWTFAFPPLNNNETGRGSGRAAALKYGVGVLINATALTFFAGSVHRWLKEEEKKSKESKIRCVNERSELCLWGTLHYPWLTTCVSQRRRGAMWASALTCYPAAIKLPGIQKPFFFLWKV